MKNTTTITTYIQGKAAITVNNGTFAGVSTSGITSLADIDALITDLAAVVLAAKTDGVQ